MRRLNIIGVAIVLLTAAFAQQSPDCVSTCTSSDRPLGDVCNSTDTQCICTTESYLADLACCLATDCPSSERAAARDEVTQYCRQVEVEVSSILDSASATCTATSTPSATGTSDPGSSGGPPLSVIVPAVVVPVVVVVAVLSSVFIMLRARRRRLSDVGAAGGLRTDETKDNSKDSTIEADFGGLASKPELDARPGFAAPVEMEGAQGALELQGTHAREMKQELEGSGSKFEAFELDAESRI